MEIIDVLKALADDTRLRILNLLIKEPLCVCDLEVILGLSQSNTSRHLIKLKNAKLITSEKRAQWVYYQVNSKMLEKHAFVKKLLEQELSKISKCLEDAEILRKEHGCRCEHDTRIAD